MKLHPNHICAFNDEEQECKCYAEGCKDRQSSAQQYAENLKDNPKEIIAWCKREIKEYEKLIKILTKRL